MESHVFGQAPREPAKVEAMAQLISDLIQQGHDPNDIHKNILNRERPSVFTASGNLGADELRSTIVLADENPDEYSLKEDDLLRHRGHTYAFSRKYGKTRTVQIITKLASIRSPLPTPPTALEPAKRPVRFCSGRDEWYTDSSFRNCRHGR
jgi:hypothetical protein